MSNEELMERRHADEVIKKINEMLNDDLKDFDDLQFRYRRDPDRYGASYRIACDRIKRFKSAKDNPYFARIDFQEDGKDNKSLYIGKYGVYDNSVGSIVVDWRSPIASLYYDSELGDASYVCPEGTISGKLNLKRQFDIENGKFLGYHDVDIVSSDDLLQQYLQQNNDMRLKNIVSTIQAEQNAAIRKPLYKNTIIQGVAGSGKTTIALHRIAYLVYNYKNSVKSNQFMVIGPNDVFLKYIESVLPDLDVNGMEQLTFEKLAKEIIDEDFNIRGSNKQLTDHLTGKDNGVISKFKNSEEYINSLSEFIDKYFESIYENDIKINGFTLISRDVVEKLYKASLEYTKDFNGVVNRFKLLASNYIINKRDAIVKDFNDYIYLVTKVYDDEKLRESILNGQVYSDGKYTIDKKMIALCSDRRKFSQYRGKVVADINKGCGTTCKSFISKYNKGPQKLYELFIKSISKGKNPTTKELCKITLDNIKKKEYDFEDLPALMYIKSRLGLPNIYKNYKHIVIDEAQDFGVANYMALKSCLPNAYFSIYGDIAQSIYDYRSIDSWDDVSKVIPDAELIPFKKSYRTTDQIMSVANSVSESIGLDSSELSVRQGEDVTFNQVDKDNIPSYIASKIEEYKKKGYKSIAVISKYPKQSLYLNDDLYAEGLYIPNIDESIDITSDNGGVFTIPGYLAKGLEFNAVIINGADEDIYNSSNETDMKLLYVASTRALHEMDVVYSNEITKPFEKFIKKDVKELKKIKED